jgi:hypothetical protein
MRNAKYWAEELACLLLFILGISGLLSLLAI